MQVLPDGADYESSVPYHRLVTELFLGAARLADHMRRAAAAAFSDRVERMVAFLAAVLRPDGLMPQIGDADDGRLHVLSEYGSWQPQDASTSLRAGRLHVPQRPDGSCRRATRGDGRANGGDSIPPVSEPAPPATPRRCGTFRTRDSP